MFKVFQNQETLKTKKKHPRPYNLKLVPSKPVEWCYMNYLDYKTLYPNIVKNTHVLIVLSKECKS